MYLLIVKEEAHLDVANAYEYYEKKQPGLGEKFLQAVIKRYNDLSQHPTHYSFIPDDPKKIFRDIKLEKFPYLVIYEIAGNEVIIYAVHNTYRNPDKKFRRQ